MFHPCRCDFPSCGELIHPKPITQAEPQPSVEELERKEEELFRTGPLSVLTTSVKTNSQVGLGAAAAAPAGGGTTR
jgi:hypothetical protein